MHPVSAIPVYSVGIVMLILLSVPSQRPSECCVGDVQLQCVSIHLSCMHTFLTLASIRPG